MDLEKLVSDAEASLSTVFQGLENTELSCSRRVLDAFQRSKVACRHFAPTTGYGYDDVGRDTLEKIFAELFFSEEAIVRPQIASGTHALSLCFFGLLLPGDELIYASGRPYDTLEGIIGIDKPLPGSLREMGVGYGQAELDKDGYPDLPAIRARITDRTKLIVLQRSRGYALRRSLMPEDIAPLADMLKKEYPQIALMVDNCYGEFVCEREPTEFGADLIAGSLIKNPGGGIAPTGGYIAGRRDLIERIAYRLTAPGIGREVGSYAASYQPFYQGLFLAPHAVCQALKTAALFSSVFGRLGFASTPSVSERRTDIITAIELQTRERLIAFCEGVQMASPIDSMALPEPWAMPGYQDEVIMAAGTFIGGASIELSADAPMRAPFAVYMQGGLTYSHGRLAVRRTLQHMKDKGCL